MGSCFHKYKLDFPYKENLARISLTGDTYRCVFLYLSQHPCGSCFLPFSVSQKNYTSVALLFVFCLSEDTEKRITVRGLSQRCCILSASFSCEGK